MDKIIENLKIKAVSFSRLEVFNKCPKWAQLAYINKLPVKDKPNTGKEPANERGSRMHDNCEAFVKGETSALIPENLSFKSELKRLKDLYPKGVIETEKSWAFDNNWNSLPDNKPFNPLIWLRIIIDATYFISDTKAVIIDYKGLALDTKIPTPSGWTTMKQIKIGDEVFDEAGRPCKVIGKSKPKNIDCYNIIFNDKTSVVCDKDHLWPTLDGVKNVKHLTTADKIALTQPIELPKQDLSIDPYILGIWLTKGKPLTGQITASDSELWKNLTANKTSTGYKTYEHRHGGQICTIYGLGTLLRQNHLLDNKHIPPIYLRSSISQRLKLLQGIYDGRGWVNITNRQAITNTVDLNLAKQIQELAVSLGQQAVIQTVKNYPQNYYIVRFRPHLINPFLINKKAIRLDSFPKGGRAWRRKIISINKTASVPTQCITVDSPTHTFLCTENFIPTHNSGKRERNEVKHGQQLQLYALTAFLRFPKLIKITVENWYLDLNELYSLHISRNKALKLYHKLWDNKLKRVTTTVSFIARPNNSNCMFCPYRTGSNKWIEGTGDCDLNPE